MSNTAVEALAEWPKMRQGVIYPDEDREEQFRQSLRDAGWNECLAACEKALSTPPVKEGREPVAPTCEREAFESWAHASGFNIDRDETEKYKNYHRATTRFARDGWLSALAWAKNVAPAAEPSEAFVRELLWGLHPECCGCPVAGAEYMGSQEMVCCGRPEMTDLNDKQIVASLRERFPE